MTVRPADFPPPFDPKEFITERLGLDSIDVLELGHGEAGMPDKKDLPPQFDKSALAFIRRNIQTLVHVVDELLGFTHLANDASGLEFEMVDAHEVIGFALKNLNSQQKGTGI